MPSVNLVDFTEAITELELSTKETDDPRELRRFERLISKLKTLQRIEQKTKKIRSDIAKAMSVTCYKNIGYCCGLKKDCIWRDSCRQALGIDDETYVAVKERMIWEMLK